MGAVEERCDQPPYSEGERYRCSRSQVMAMDGVLDPSLLDVPMLGLEQDRAPVFLDVERVLE